MTDLTEVALKSKQEHRQLNFVLQRERINDLLGQIEHLKVLLTSTDPEVVLRASQEIRDIHAAITEITKVQAMTDPEPRFRRRKWIPKAERKPRKVVPKTDDSTNIFRPQ